MNSLIAAIAFAALAFCVKSFADTLMSCGLYMQSPEARAKSRDTGLWLNYLASILMLTAGTLLITHFLPPEIQ